MRVAVWHNLPGGGAKRALFTQVKGLLHRGHEVEAWCPPTADQSFLPLTELIPEHVVDLRFDGRPPWWRPGRRAALASPRPLIEALLDHSRRCASAMQRGRFDVYLASTCQFFGSPPIGRFLPSPRALYLQEPHRGLYEASPDFPWLGPALPESVRERSLYPFRMALEAVRSGRRAARARFEVDNAKAFDAVLVNSLYSREGVLRVYGREARVCYLGVDSALFRPLERPRIDMVVGVGDLSTRKNALLLIEAVGLLASPRPRVEWFAPNVDSSYSRQVAAVARRLDVELLVHEAADDDALVEAFNRATAAVYVPRLEPFGLVPLEAGACGLPVIGVAEGGVRETVVDGINGLVVDPRPHDVADAITRLRTDPALAAELGRNGRRIVEARWTQDAAAERLERALVKLTSETRNTHGSGLSGRLPK
jgi:glycosyltransferase involved in cell wall biosynthesis